MGETTISVVTVDGALYMGAGPASIGQTPVIASGVINVSGGYNSKVALVDEGQRFGIRSWTGNGAPAPITLPNEAEPAQVSGNYGLACALDTAGLVYCWDAGGNHQLSEVGATAARRERINEPVRHISVGQNGVCGVTFDNRLLCNFAGYNSPFLPSEATGTGPEDFRVRPNTFPSVLEIHAGFQQGSVVRTDGTAFFLPGNAFGQDNPGIQFQGATNVVASGGDRGISCVVTAAGDVFCMLGTGGVTQRATLGGAPLVAQAAQCPL